MVSLAESPPRLQKDSFIELFNAAQPDLSRYVYSMVRDRDAVDDVMQDLAVALWKKFDDYDPDRPFLPWSSASAACTAT